MGPSRASVHAGPIFERARECARGSTPLLDKAVGEAVADYTNVYEELFGRLETGADIKDVEPRLVTTRQALDRTIEACLKSLPRA